MSFAVDPARLAYQMAVRGLSASDLARKARVSPATLSAARAGKRVREDSWRQVARALNETPVDPDIERLLPPPDALATTALKVRSHRREVSHFGCCQRRSRGMSARIIDS